jgi:hypothetical protein
VDPRYQRDDWRDALHAATRGPGPRALAISPSAGAIPAQVYVPRAVALPPQGAAVREVDAVTLPVRRPGRGLVVPPLPTPAPPPGFVLVERRTTKTYALARFRAPRPTPVDPVLVAAHAFPTSPPALLLDP